MKKLFWLLVFGGLIFWGGREAYRLAAPASIPMPQAQVETVQGEVKYKAQGKGDWQIVSQGQILKTSDSLKTGATGQVVLNFYDNSVARLDSNSEAQIKTLTIDSKNIANNKVTLKLNLGRIWARIVNLADREASFEVEASNTVATVRGTTLSIANDGKGNINMDTVDSLVQYRILDAKNSAKQLSELMVPAGKSARFSGGKASLATSSNELKDDNWYKQNNKQDAQFEIALRQKNLELNKAIAGSISPDAKLYQVKLFGERLQMMLAQDEVRVQQLKVAFLNRRMAEAEEMFMAGKTGLAQVLANQFSSGASSMLMELKKQNLLRNNLEQMTEIESSIKNQLNLQKKLMVGLAPNDPIYPIKEKIGEFELNLADNDEEKAYLLMKQAEELLHSAKQYEKTDPAGYKKLMADYNAKYNSIPGKNADVYKKRLRLIEESVTLPSIMLPVKPAATASTATGTQATSSVFKRAIDSAKNLDEIQKRAVEEVNKVMQDEIKPLIQSKLPATKPAGETTNTAAPTPTPIPVPTQDTAVKVPVIPVAEVAKPTSMSITVGQRNMTAGSGQQLKAMVKFSDGSILNKTAEASWSVSGDLGSISGGYLKTNAGGGSGVVSASAVIDGVSLSASTLEITALSLIQ